MNYLFLKGVMWRYCSHSCRHMLYSAVQWRLQMSHPHRIHAVILACLLCGLLSLIITAMLRRPFPLHRYTGTASPKARASPRNHPPPQASPANPAADIASLAPYTLSKRRATARTSILLSTLSSP